MKKTSLVLGGILGCALVIRVFMLAQVNSADFYAAPWYVGDGGDAAEYSAIAENIVRGDGYTLAGRQTTIRPPGYVLFLAGTYRIFGIWNLAAARAAQIALALGTLMLFWALARNITGSVLVAHLATLALGLYPRYAIYNLVILSETLFLALMIATIFFAERFSAKRLSVFFALSMAALAASALTRSTALYAVPVFFIWGWWMCRTPPVKKGAGILLPGLVVFLLVLAPWAVYNYARLGTFTFTTKSGGGLAEAWDRTVLEPLGISDRDILTPYQRLSEEEFSKIGYRLFFTEIRDHPLRIARFTFLKSVYWVNPFAKSSSAIFRAGHAVMMTAIFALGAWGMYRFWRLRKHPALILIFLVMATFSAMHILTVPYHRYRFPVVDPYLILFASYAVIHIFGGLRRVVAIPSPKNPNDKIQSPNDPTGSSRT